MRRGLVPGGKEGDRRKSDERTGERSKQGRKVSMTKRKRSIDVEETNEAKGKGEKGAKEGWKVRNKKNKEESKNKKGRGGISKGNK